jgi:hypothetical protein
MAYVATVRSRTGAVEYVSPPCDTRQGAEKLALEAMPESRRVMTSRANPDGSASDDDTRFLLRLGDPWTTPEEVSRDTDSEG